MLKEFQPALIVWRDAVTPDRGGWIDRDELIKWKRGSLCKTMGFIVDENKVAITIAGSMTFSVDDAKPETYSGTFVILKSMIQSIKRFK